MIQDDDQRVSHRIEVRTHTPTQEHIQYSHTLTPQIQKITSHFSLLKYNYSNPNSKLNKLTSKSDLIPHVYEGGLKLWECSLDVSHYLIENPIIAKRILELGCGHGLPSITLLKLSSDSNIHFTLQDLNEEVLNHLTIPNAISNLRDTKNDLDDEKILQSLKQKIRFVSGDWSQTNMANELMNDPILSEKNKFDLIITTDTIYSLESQSVLFELIKMCLRKSKTAECLIGAKRVYFGVGGDTFSFVEMIKHDGKMEIEIVKVINNGKSNLREILKLKWKEGFCTEI